MAKNCCVSLLHIFPDTGGRICRSVPLHRCGWCGTLDDYFVIDYWYGYPVDPPYEVDQPSKALCVEVTREEWECQAGVAYQYTSGIYSNELEYDECMTQCGQ